MSEEAAGVRRAAVLGTVTGARTFLAPAALALRGRLGTTAKIALPALAAGELVGDKLAIAPPRVQGAGLVGRVLSGALVGRAVGGGRGARSAAAFAPAATYPSQLLRAEIVRRTPLPDIACAVPEDIIGATLAAAASSEPRPLPADGPKTGQEVRFSAHRPEGRHGFVSAGGFGMAAGLVGAGATTTAEEWVRGFNGGSRPPRPDAGLRVLRGAGSGLLLGLTLGRGERPPGPGAGVAFGLAAWLAGLAELHARGLADPPWRRSPAALAEDLGLHLVYGAATAAAYEAFTA